MKAMENWYLLLMESTLGSHLSQTIMTVVKIVLTFLTEYGMMFLATRKSFLFVNQHEKSNFKLFE